jgi:hypothetical protein
MLSRTHAGVSRLVGRPGGWTLLQRLSLALSLLTLAGCDLAYPEVVVVNGTAAQVQLRNLSFNGCAWDTVLAQGEATSPGRCLPGEDRVHFEKFDAGKVSDVPTWFAYQTVTVHRVDYGEFHVFEVTVDDMEQDFSVPGPYGH